MKYSLLAAAVSAAVVPSLLISSLAATLAPKVAEAESGPEQGNQWSGQALAEPRVLWDVDTSTETPNAAFGRAWKLGQKHQVELAGALVCGAGDWEYNGILITHVGDHESAQVPAAALGFRAGDYRVCGTWHTHPNSVATFGDAVSRTKAGPSDQDIRTWNRLSGDHIMIDIRGKWVQTHDAKRLFCAWDSEMVTMPKCIRSD